MHMTMGPISLLIYLVIEKYLNWKNNNWPYKVTAKRLAQGLSLRVEFYHPSYSIDVEPMTDMSCYILNKQTNKNGNQEVNITWVPFILTSTGLHLPMVPKQ